MNRLNTANNGRDNLALRRCRFGSPSGFTLLEMMIVVAIVMITSAFTIFSIKPMLQQSRVDSAYNSALGTMRRAHDQAASERRVFVVAFDNTKTPNTLTISQNDTVAAGGLLQLTTVLPTDITFHTETGIPTTTTGVCPSPDGFGLGNKGIDFDQGVGGGATSIYFYPDGSAHDKALNGNINNGVVYMARPGELYSSRAITVWGTTGRIRGWRLYGGSSNCWRPQ